MTTLGCHMFLGFIKTPQLDSGIHMRLQLHGTRRSFGSEDCANAGIHGT